MSSRWLIEAFMFQPSLFMSSQILQLCISFPAGWASQRVSNGVTTPKNPTKRSPIDPILHWEEHQESHRITFHSQHPQRTLTKHSNPFVYTGCSAYDGSCLLLVSPCCGTDSLKRNGCALGRCNSCRRWVFFLQMVSPQSSCNYPSEQSIAMQDLGHCLPAHVPHRQDPLLCPWHSESPWRFLHEAHLIVLACMDPSICSKTRLGWHVPDLLEAFEGKMEVGGVHDIRRSICLWTSRVLCTWKEIQPGS